MSTHTLNLFRKRNSSKEPVKRKGRKVIFGHIYGFLCGGSKTSNSNNSSNSSNKTGEQQVMPPVTLYPIWYILSLLSPSFSH